MGKDTQPLRPRPPLAPCRHGVELQQPGSDAPEDGVSRKWPEAEVRPPEVRPGGCTGTRQPGSMPESRRCVHTRPDPTVRLLSWARALDGALISGEPLSFAPSHCGLSREILRKDRHEGKGEPVTPALSRGAGPSLSLAVLPPPLLYLFPSLLLKHIEGEKKETLRSAVSRAAV